MGKNNPKRSKDTGKVLLTHIVKKSHSFHDNRWWSDDDDKIISWNVEALPLMDWYENHFNDIENFKPYPMKKEDIIELRDFCKKITEDNNLTSVESMKKKIWTPSEILDQDRQISIFDKLWDDLEVLIMTEDYDNLYFWAWW